jgi:large repetitive protein
VRIDPGIVPTSIRNTATVENLSGLDFNPGNNGVSVRTQIRTEIDLEITKSSSPDPVIAGGELTYTLNVRNNGPLPAGNVRVTYKLPEGVHL